jgi:hypothetical protein
MATIAKYLYGDPFKPDFDGLVTYNMGPNI